MPLWCVQCYYSGKMLANQNMEALHLRELYVYMAFRLKNTNLNIMPCSWKTKAASLKCFSCKPWHINTCFFHLKYTGLSNTLTVRWPDIAALCKNISALFDLEYLSFCLHAPDLPCLYSFSTVEGILFAVDFAWRPRFYFPGILIALAVAWDCLVHLPGERTKLFSWTVQVSLSAETPQPNPQKGTRKNILAYTPHAKAVVMALSSFIHYWLAKGFLSI